MKLMSRPSRPHTVVRRAANYCIEQLEQRILLAAVSWTGNGDGINWSDPANWTSNPLLPGPADDVTIHFTIPTIQFTAAAGIVTIRNFDLATRVTISGGSLTVSERTQMFAGVLRVEGQGVSFSGKGTAGITGQLEAHSGGQLEILQKTTFTRASLLVTTSGQMSFPAAASYNNSTSLNSYSLSADGAGSRIDLSSLTSFVGSGLTGGTTGIHVSAGGQIDLSGTTGALTSVSVVVAGATSSLLVPGVNSLESAGVQVQMGGSLTFPAVTSLSNVSLIAETGGQLAFPAADTLDNSGAGSASVYATESTSYIDLTHLTSLVGGNGFGFGTDVAAMWGGRVDLAGSVADVSLILFGATSRITCDGTTQAKSVRLGDGVLAGSGDVTVTSSFNWTGGTLAGTGKTIIATGATGSISSDTDPKTLSRGLENAGTLDLNSAISTLTLTGGVITNLAGGEFTISDLSFLNGGGNNALNNAGTLRVTGAGIAQCAIPFNNSGSVEVLAGTLDLSGGGTGSGDFAISGGALLRFAGGAYALGSANITGAGIILISGGSVTHDGVVDITGATFVSGGVATFGTFSAGSLLMSDGQVTFNQGATINGPLDMPGPSALLLPPSGALILRVRGLSVGPQAQVNIADNVVIVDYTKGRSAALDNVKSLITSGYSGGLWSGPGISSTSAAANPNRAVGYAEASALTTIPPIFGSVDSTAILIRYTRYGDADLDGTVDSDDFNRLAGSFGQSNTVWSQGNFNFDNATNSDDFNLLASNFGQSAADVFARGRAIAPRIVQGLFADDDTALL